MSVSTPTEEASNESQATTASATEESVTEETTEEVVQPTAEEFEKTKKALAKANEEAKNFRLELKELRERSESEQEKALRTAKEEGEEEATSRFRSKLALSEAKAALAAAEVAPEKLERSLKLIDLDAVELDEDLNVTGIDSQVKELKKDFPELFQTDEKKAPKVQSDDQKTPVGTQAKSSAERIAQQVQGEE